ncbi:lipopolysaccharide-induced tumor necrosis factor-alpha factor homolog [Mercenaria mercenaria]|uniref:lipopolysaccharide-induced tumor necrosis factor-alpha factor homolog n=1 Tax=Mercenaria mercenaria TaxID=6596 RepID=UPI00234F9CBE|nr:lipopolysaccharide-induced tumor necrosis factor-alpha factor homolog [Mercenaria mercenaria]
MKSTVIHEQDLVNFDDDDDDNDDGYDKENLVASLHDARRKGYPGSTIIGFRHKDRIKSTVSMSDAPPPYPGEKTDYPTQNQGQYAPYQQQSDTNIIVSQPVTVVQTYRECSLRIVCPFCHAEVVTSTYYEPGTLTWLACFLIVLFFPLGCCLIPFCMDGMKDVVHRCPNCGAETGRFNRM